MTYGKIDWTVATATSELSYGGKQADKGMEFVVVKSTLSFVMPQGSTNFTLVFLPSSAYGITTQSTVDFQIA